MRHENTLSHSICTHYSYCANKCDTLHSHSCTRGNARIRRTWATRGRCRFFSLSRRLLHISSIHMTVEEHVREAEGGVRGVVIGWHVLSQCIEEKNRLVLSSAWLLCSRCHRIQCMLQTLIKKETDETKARRCPYFSPLSFFSFIKLPTWSKAGPCP